MQLTELTVLTEMGKAKICPTCGHTTVGYHYYSKGTWHCTKSALASPGPGVAKSAATPPAKPTNAVATPPATPAPKPTPAAKKPTATPANQVESWLTGHGITNFSIDEKGLINVEGDAHLDHFNNVKLPVKFGTVNGDFSCFGSSLQDMDGMPMVVTGSCSVNHNKLKSFVGGPRSVGSDNDPHGASHYDISMNSEVTSIEGLPHIINGSLIAKGLKSLKTLQGIHKVIKRLNGAVDFTDTPIESNVLGLIMIRGLTEVRLANSDISDIINKHLGGERDINICQEELIDAGFGKFAKL